MCKVSVALVMVASLLATGVVRGDVSLGTNGTKTEGACDNREGGIGVSGSGHSQTCKVTWTFPGPSGDYEIIVIALQERDGSPGYKVSLNGKQIKSGQVGNAYGGLICDKNCPDGGGWRSCWPNKKVDLKCGKHRVNKGDKITYAVTSAYPCGSSHGAYGITYGVKFKGSASGGDGGGDGGGGDDGGGSGGNVKIVEPSGSELTIGKEYTLKAEGDNIKWYYDIAGDNKPWFDLGEGSTVKYTIPDVSTSQFTLKAEGSGGSDQKGYSLKGGGGGSTEPSCGNGKCESGEDCSSCEQDCGACENTTEVKIIEPTGEELTIGKEYTLKAEGNNIKWYYDIAGDNKEWFDLGEGNEVKYTIPDVSTSQFTLKAEGDGGDDQKGFKLAQSSSDNTDKTDNTDNTDDKTDKTDNTGSTSGNVAYELYNGQFDRLPDFDGLTADEEGSVPSFTIGDVTNSSSNYAVRFTCFIDIAREGDYTFSTSSDDGSALYIGDTKVVDNDGMHAMEEKSGTIKLGEGTYPITVTFFQAGGGQGLDVAWKTPGSSSAQQIPQDKLLATGPDNTDLSDRGIGIDASNGGFSVAASRTRVTISGLDPSGTYTVQFLDLSGSVLGTSVVKGLSGAVAPMPSVAQEVLLLRVQGGSRDITRKIIRE